MKAFFGGGLLGDDVMVPAAGQGRLLRTMVAGEGDDLVVLEAGLGISGLYWQPVHNLLAPHVRVVAYERAGYGASTPADGEPRDLAHLADDLAAVANHFPHKRLVLAGHSWGGPIVRTCAANHSQIKDTLVGIVLVDQSDEHAADIYTSLTSRLFTGLQGLLYEPMAGVKLLHPLLKNMLRGLPPQALQAAVGASGTVNAARAASRENSCIISGMFRLAAAPPQIGDVPLSVISGRQVPRLLQSRARLIAAHRKTALEHPDATYVPAHKSGHMIPLTEPELIAEQALKLLAETV